MRKRNDERVNRMYERYQSGKSLAEVASEFGISRQSVYQMFALRKFKLRELPKRKPYQEFNGSKYTIGANGYYRKTYGNRSLMHRDVWEFFNGEIPEGWHCPE